MLRRPLSAATLTLTKERILRPNRVEEFRPKSHPAAECADIILEPEGAMPTAHRYRCVRCSLGSFDADVWECLLNTVGRLVSQHISASPYRRAIVSERSLDCRSYCFQRGPD